ncbi:MAG: efflux RND transporter periplasmic adaptor subunit [Verrucomicrobiales bacterium]
MNEAFFIKGQALRLFVAGSMLAGFSACERKGPTSPPSAVAQVSVAAPIERTIMNWDEFTGRIDAMESVEVRPRVTGHLQEIPFQAGQLVKKGDVLFVIDPRWHRATLDNAEAQLQLAKVNLANAERDAQRSVSLAKSAAALSGREADTRRTRLAAARAGVQAAAAARQAAALDLEATQVRSPIDGRVSRPLLTTGNYVSGVAGFTTLLTTVVSVDAVHVYASVDEASFLKHARLLRERKLPANADGKIPAEARLEGELDFVHKGWIESFDNRIDPATGSIVLRAVIPIRRGKWCLEALRAFGSPRAARRGHCWSTRGLSARIKARSLC